MPSPVLNDTLDIVEEWIVVIQPSSSISQMRLVLFYRNQPCHRFSSFRQEDSLFLVGNTTQDLGKVLLGFRNVHRLFCHWYHPPLRIGTVTLAILDNNVNGKALFRLSWPAQGSKVFQQQLLRRPKSSSPLSSLPWREGPREGDEHLRSPEAVEKLPCTVWQDA